MKLGADTESLHLWLQNRRMDVFDFIELAKNIGFDGVVINLVEKKNLEQGLGTLGANDPAHLRRVRGFIEDRGMYVELAGRGTHKETLSRLIDVADRVGAGVLRIYVMSGGGYSRSELGGLWNEENFYRAAESIRTVTPLLEQTGISLAVENHELETCGEIRRLIEMVGHPQVGALYDAGNTVMAWEDPVEGLKKLLPYVKTTHLKDQTICDYRGETFICGTALGEGNIDLREIVRLLETCTDLDHVNIEMCAPYASRFKRPKGTGGVKKAGQGAFSMGPLPLPEKIGSPEHYYVYDGPYLEAVMRRQMEDFKSSYRYMRNLLEEVACQRQEGFGKKDMETCAGKVRRTDSVTRSCMSTECM